MFAPAPSWGPVQRQDPQDGESWFRLVFVGQGLPFKCDRRVLQVRGVQDKRVAR
jgi:hypothetical protein